MSTPIVDAFEILDRIKDGFFALDQDWNFTYVNKEAARLLFRSRKDIIGKNIWDEFPEAVNLPFYEQYHKAIKAQIPVIFDAYFPPLKAWFGVRAYPSLNGLSVYFQDLSKEKMEIKEREEHFKSLFEHNPDAVFSFDLDGNYLSVNAAMEKLLGYNEEEFLQKSFISLVSKDDLERTIQHYKIAAGGTTQRYVTKAIHKNGSIVYVDVTNMPIIVNNEVVGVYGIAKNITDRIYEQEKLKQHEELFKLISENSQDIIAITSPEGLIEYASPSIKTLLGYEPEEIVGMIRFELWHPDDVLIHGDFQNSYNKNESIFARRVKHKEGHYVWIETNVKTIRNEQGDMIHAIGISRDITERKLAEDELRRTKERLQSFVQNNADAIWVMDMQDRIIEINPSFETMFGWCAQSVIGKELPIVPDFMEEFIHDIHQKVKTGMSVAGLETIRQRKDGSLLDVSTTLSPIVNSKGKVIGITGICRDITPRKKAEGTLRAKIQQIESFIENNVDAIIVLDLQARVQRVNKAFEQTFGWKKEEVVGVQLYELPIIPADRIEESKSFEAAVKKGDPLLGIETLRMRRDGVLLNVMLTLTPINDEDGNFAGWSKTIRDLTEWKKSQQILQNTEKLSVAGQLAAGIAHEIRNPITAIKGFIQLMRSGFIDKKEYYEIISSEIERIEQILSELLLLAKPQVGKLERKDVTVLLNQIITLLDTQAIINNVEIITKFLDEGIFISCDENQLKQVFINFIKNAIEAMPTGGSLVIEVRKINNEKITIRFMDEGVGMSEEVLAKMGQPFYTTKDKGTGLGFMISKRIIENHGGEVHIWSKVNKGTTIEVIMPIN